MTTLTGTEAQIAQAANIRLEMLGLCDSRITEIDTELTAPDTTDKRIARLDRTRSNYEALKDRLVNIPFAGWFIHYHLCSTLDLMSWSKPEYYDQWVKVHAAA